MANPNGEASEDGSESGEEDDGGGGMETEAEDGAAPSSLASQEEAASRIAEGRLSYAGAVKRRKEGDLPTGPRVCQMLPARHNSGKGEVSLPLQSLITLCRKHPCPSEETCKEVGIDPSSMASWLEDTMRTGVCIFFMAKNIRGMQVRNWVRSLSSGEDPLQIVFLGRSCFYVKCKDYRQKFSLLSRSGAWAENIFGIPLPWEESFDPSSEFSDRCPVWILLKNVPIFLLDHVEEVLSHLGKILYFPKFGPYVHSRSFKVCVLWHLDEALPAYLRIPVKGKDAFYIQLVFDPFPLACFKCNRMGHYARVCPVLSMPENQKQSISEEKMSTTDIQDKSQMLDRKMQDLNSQQGEGQRTEHLDSSNNSAADFALALAATIQKANDGATSVKTENAFDILADGSCMDTEQKSPLADLNGVPSSQENLFQAPQRRSKKRKLKKKKKKSNKEKTESAKENKEPILYVELNEDKQSGDEANEMSSMRVDEDQDEEKDTSQYGKQYEEQILQTTSPSTQEEEQDDETALPWISKFYKKERKKYYIPAEFFLNEGELWVSHDKLKWQIIEFFTSNELDPTEVVFVTKEGNKVYNGSIP